MTTAPQASVDLLSRGFIALVLGEAASKCLGVEGPLEQGRIIFDSEPSAHDWILRIHLAQLER